MKTGEEVNPIGVSQHLDKAHVVLAPQGEDYALYLENERQAAATTSSSSSSSYAGGYAGLLNVNLGGCKRDRSISGRLRLVSTLVADGVIGVEMKGTLKDLIINGDRRLEGALHEYDRGDVEAIRGA